MSKIIYIFVFVMMFPVIVCSQVMLGWNPVDDVELSGYRVHWTKTQGIPYESNVDIKNVTEYSLSELDLPAGRYYFVVTAYARDGTESAFSNENEINISGSISAPQNVRVTITIEVR